jgi:hypothetical protein
MLLLSIGACAHGHADTFFGPATFDTCGVALPPRMDIAALTAVLDADPHATVHAQALIDVCETNQGTSLLKVLSDRSDQDSGDMLRRFDYGFASVLLGVNADQQETVNTGIRALRTAAERTDNPVMWLVYGMALAHIDVVQIGRSRYTISPMKTSAMDAVQRAVTLQARFPQRGFDGSLAVAIERFAAVPAYEKFCAALRAAVLPRSTLLEYWNGLLVLRGNDVRVGNNALAATWADSTYLLNLATWRLDLQLYHVDDYEFCANGMLLAVNQNGALPIYAARTAKRVARVPRVHEWFVAGDSSVCVVRNPGSPERVYDYDVIDAATGEILITLARTFPRRTDIYGVAVSYDRSLAAVHYQVAPDEPLADIWDITTGRLLGTLANPGGLPVLWSPDNRTLLRSAAPAEYALGNTRVLSGVRGTVHPIGAGDIRIPLPQPCRRAAFLDNGAVLLCWSDEQSPCDAFGLYDLTQGGAPILTSSSNRYDGLAFADIGAWFATWRHGELTLHDMRPRQRGRTILQTNFSDRVVAVAVARNGNMLAAATAAGEIQAWCLERDKLLTLAPIVTADRTLERVAFEADSRYLIARSSSNAAVFVAALESGGMFDSFSVLGWTPMTKAPLDARASAQTASVQTRHATPAPTTATVVSNTCTRFQIVENVRMRDLNGDGRDDALITGLGAILEVPSNTLYFANGIARATVLDDLHLRPCYAVFYRGPDDAWQPVLLGETDATGAAPVSVNIVTFSNMPTVCLETVVQRAAGPPCRHLLACNPASVTPLLQVTNAMQAARMTMDAETALIALIQPLYTPFQEFQPDIAGLEYQTDYSADAATLRLAAETLRFTPAFTLAASNTTAIGRLLCARQAAFAAGRETWLGTPQGYATRVFSAMTPFVLDAQGKGTAILRSTALAHDGKRVFLYQPFHTMTPSSIWHHAVLPLTPCASAEQMDALYPKPTAPLQIIAPAAAPR